MKTYRKIGKIIIALLTAAIFTLDIAGKEAIKTEALENRPQDGDDFICLDVKNSQCKEFQNVQVDLPLARSDFYYGKYNNAKAGVNQLNRIPVLTPGRRIRVIADGYITLSRSAGYIKAAEPFYYASGVCWSTSTLGALMDEANKSFTKKYGLPIFVFNRGDRVPHDEYARTYKNSNYGFGYTIIKSGSYVQDYSFTINPEIKNNPDIADIRLKIVMTASETNPAGFTGKSIGAYLVSNREF